VLFLQTFVPQVCFHHIPNEPASKNLHNKDMIVLCRLHTSH
jgi:hypothetical protein